MLCFGGEKLQKSLYHIPALDWNVRIPFEALGVNHMCEWSSRGAIVCVGVVVSYPSESLAKLWTYEVRAVLGSEVILGNCSHQGFKNFDLWSKREYPFNRATCCRQVQLSKQENEH